MTLLIKPSKIYLKKDGLTWNDGMAYLNEDIINFSNLQQSSQTSKKNKGLLKCGFIITGWPKIVWAIYVQGVSIEADNLNNMWYQINTDMLLTRYDDLAKYRSKVQNALEFGTRLSIENNKNTSKESPNCAGKKIL